MDEKPPPRKQLRLLVKGREKVTELLGKRRRAKRNGKNRSTHKSLEDSDVEEGVPILSKIADPASFLSLDPRLALKSTANKTSESRPTPSAVPSTANSNGFIQHKSPAEKLAAIDEEVRTIRRRKDLNDSQEQKTTTPTGLSTDSLTTRKRPLTAQPFAAHEDTKFTFQNFPSSPSTTSNTPASDFCTFTKRHPHFKTQKTAQSAVPSPRPRLEHFTKDLGSPEKPGRGTQISRSNKQAHGVRGADKTAIQFRATESSKTSSQTAAVQHVPPKRLFDSFKLGNEPTNRAPRIDRASPVANVSFFIQPQVPIPEFGPEIYRSFHHKLHLSRGVLEKCLPDSVESKTFIDDVESGLMQGKKNASGDTSALVNDAHTERVPLRARIGDPATRIRGMICAGQPVMQPATQWCQPSAKPRDSMDIPENLYTESGRLVKAYFPALLAGSLKRKRPTGTTLPPPASVHKPASSSNFNIFANGILLHPELCLLLAAQLPVQALINLYSISKDFHIILNQRLTTVVLNQVSLKAPAAVRCYPWRCYAELCQPDPAYKAGTSSIGSHLQALTTDGAIINVPLPPPPTLEVTVLPGNKTITTGPRNSLVRPVPSKRRVPTFRWLHMCLHREKTIHEIYHLFAGRGVPLPGHPTDLSRHSFALSLHKLWFAFDIPDNPRRIAYFRSTTIITQYDLANLLTFIVKLDMVFNDPVAGEKRDAMRKLVMSSVNGLDTLRRVLKKEIWTDEMEVLRAWTRYGFDLDREDPNEHVRAGGGWVPMNLTEDDFAASDNIFGIPRDEVGLLRKEFWGKFDYNEGTRMRTICPAGRRTHSLMRPDQIMLREAIRRGMKMGKQFLKAVLVGYVDEVTLGPVEPRDLNGGRGKILEEEGEYGLDDLVGGVRALDVEEGGDPLLDLGNSYEGSPLTLKHIRARKQQVERRRTERERLEEYKREWREDVEKENARKAYRGFTYVDE